MDRIVDVRMRKSEAAKRRRNPRPEALCTRAEVSMRQPIDVATGCVTAAFSPALLRSTPLGSCIAVVLLDPVRAIGAMAHVMLPGPAPAHARGPDLTRHAPDAIDRMIARMRALGSSPDRLRAAFIGGANVLRRPDDSIASANVESVNRRMQRHHVRIVAHDLGGCLRRRAILDLGHGSILSACGDSGPTLLWCAAETRDVPHHGLRCGKTLHSHEFDPGETTGYRGDP